MFNKSNHNNINEINLYNSIVLLSRNKIFYTKFDLSDTFQNRIHLVFIHISFLFNKVKDNKNNKIYKVFYQRMFDLIFNKIEQNMREIGYGDVTINKNMKLLVKVFYNILLNCENFNKKNAVSKKDFLIKNFEFKNDSKKPYNSVLTIYFEKYQAFCFDLSSDSVLKGVINFNYI